MHSEDYDDTDQPTHPEELAFYSNDQLVYELMSRFDSAIFNGTKYSGGESHYMAKWKGTIIERVGLCSVLDYHMQRANDKNERLTDGFNPGEPEED